MVEVWGVQLNGDVEEIVEELRRELKGKLLKDLEDIGTNLMVTCISHKDGQENNPSLGILKHDKYSGGAVIPAGTVNCFTCGYTASLPEFISNCFGYNDGGQYGYKWLIKHFGIEPGNRPDIKVNMERFTGKSEEDNGEYVTEEELECYRYIHPYMQERKLTEKVIEYFDVGYCRETNSITFPVHDKDGNVLFIQRRRVKGKGFHFPKGSDNSGILYGEYQLRKNLTWAKEVWVTESVIDALTLWGYRIPAVALFRAMATKKQIELLRRLPVRKIVLALDNDEAGRDGVDLIFNALRGEKLLYRLDLGEYKDVNEAPAEVIKNAEPKLLIST